MVARKAFLAVVATLVGASAAVSIGISSSSAKSPVTARPHRPPSGVAGQAGVTTGTVDRQFFHSRPSARVIQPPAPPPDAVFVWGRDSWASPIPPGYVARVPATAAVSLFRSQAFSARERRNVEPEVHLWTYNDRGAGVSSPAWVLIFRHVAHDPPGAPDWAPQHYSGCIESYVVGADTGAGIVNSFDCP